MIKFFRKIRQRLLLEGKTRPTESSGRAGKPVWPVGRYFKYAVGEIVLVVIGILIALAINSWNQERLSNQQQKVYLNNFKKELESSIELLQRIDEQYAVHEEETAKGIILLTEDFRISNFKAIDSLISTRWRAFPVSRSTYDEMMNNGSFYALQNQKLKNQIDRHYIVANSYASAFKEMNSIGQGIYNSKDLNPLEVLRYRLRHPPVNLTDIDTSWVHNPNSRIYEGIFKRAMHCEITNKMRRNLIKGIIQSSYDLIDSIDNELGKHD